MRLRRQQDVQSSPSIAETAAAWALEEQHGLSDRRQAARDAWLEENGDHAEAYRVARSALAALDRYAAHPEIMGLRKSALAARPPRRPISFLHMASGAAALLLAIAASYWATQRRVEVPDTASLPSATVAPEATVPAPVRYSTAVGERSTVALQDGSIMVLNTASAAEVVYTSAERKVHLLHGQALFTVAHGRPMPFRVYAADRVITAVGTVFDVRLDGARVRVAMLEGSVRVDAPVAAVSADVTGETLSAGETLIAAPAEPVRVKTENVERLASWRSGLLTFEDTRLQDAIAEINRYTTRPLSLRDPEAAGYRVSGTFRVGDAERFAVAMTEVFPLELGHLPDGRPFLQSRSSPRSRSNVPGTRDADR